MFKLSVISKFLLHLLKLFQIDYFLLFSFDHYINSSMYKSKKFLFVPLRFLLPLLAELRILSTFCVCSSELGSMYPSWLTWLCWNHVLLQISKAFQLSGKIIEPCLIYQLMIGINVISDWFGTLTIYEIFLGVMTYMYYRRQIRTAVMFDGYIGLIICDN